MIRFTAKRLISGIVLLICVSTGTFFLAHLVIGDPTMGLLGNSATHAQQLALAHKIGIDRPILVQFWDWASHAVVGDFGNSWSNFQSVSSQVALKMPVTLSVVAFATFLAGLFGGIFGVIAGLKPGTIIDRVVKFSSIILFALPGFWVALILVLWFAVDLSWFPAVGYVQPSLSFFGWLQSITLPAVSLALAAIVMVAEQLRNAVIATNNQDFVRTLRSRGLSRPRVVVHLVRNAAPASLTVLALMFVGLLSGAIVVEQIFSLPGIGLATNGASQVGDIPILLGITVVTIVFVVIVNFLLDLILGWINPKARVQ